MTTNPQTTPKIKQGYTDAKTNGPCSNTDREIWRRKEGDYYSPSLHVTEQGGIGVNVGGYVRVMTVEEWAAAGALYGKARSLLNV